MSANTAVERVENFWREVWQARDPHAALRFVADDFVITSGGVETFQNVEGTRVASRWKLSGKNKGFVGGRACGTPFVMLGTAVWEVRPDGLLQHNWVERNALEVRRDLIGL